MENSKLLILLRKLTSRECTRFEDYAHSPYFNKHEPTQRLCKYLMRLAPDFNHKRKLQAEQAFSYVFPEKEYDYMTLHRTLAQLLELLQNFLIDESPKPLPRQIQLMRQLRKRRADKHYPIATRRYSRLRKRYVQEHSYRYYNDYLFHQELDARFVDRGEHHYDEHLQKQSDSLDLFFLTSKLKIACDMASRNVVTQADYQCGLLPEVQIYLDSHQKENFPALLWVYQTILRMRTTTEEESEKYYTQLKNLLFDHASEFTKLELLDMYGYALNYAIQQFNRGRAEYMRELFQHYKFLIEQQIVFVDGYLPVWDYINTATSAMRVQEYDWARQFIHSHRQHLMPGQNSAYSFALASLYAQMGDYPAALEALYEVEFSDPTYHIKAKIIQLQSYYALEEGQALLSLIETLMNYLRRKEISDYWRPAILNTLRLTKKLEKLREQKKLLKQSQFAKNYKKFENLLATTTPLANKDWLATATEKLAPKIVKK